MPYLVKIKEIVYAAENALNSDLPNELDFVFDEEIDEQYLQEELLQHIEEHIGQEVSSFSCTYDFIDSLPD